MNTKPLIRYSPASVEVETGIGCYDELSMQPSQYGDYISRDELIVRLEKELADAAPDGTSDALRTVLEWLGK